MVGLKAWHPLDIKSAGYHEACIEFRYQPQPWHMETTYAIIRPQLCINLFQH